MLVCVPGTLISRPQLSRRPYEALPVTASHANDTLHDVLPVVRRLNCPAGGFFVGDFADAISSAESIDGVSGTVVSWHAAITRTDPVTAHDIDCRSPKRIRG